MLGAAPPTFPLLAAASCDGFGSRGNGRANTPAPAPLQGPADLFCGILRGLTLAHELPYLGGDPEHLLFAGPHAEGFPDHSQGPIGWDPGLHKVGQD